MPPHPKMFDEISMYLDPMIARTQLPRILFDSCMLRFARRFVDSVGNINMEEYMDFVQHELHLLLEGPLGIFDKYQMCMGMGEDNADWKMFQDAFDGSSGEVKRNRNLGGAPVSSVPHGRGRNRKDIARVANMNEICRVFAIRQPTVDMISEMNYENDAATLAEYAKKPCEHHQRLIRNSAKAKSGVLSQEQIDDACARIHNNECCLAWDNKLLKCTIHPGGYEKIIEIYMTNGDEEKSKRRWKEAAEVINGVSAGSSASGAINCVIQSSEYGYLLSIGDGAAEHMNAVLLSEDLSLENRTSCV